MKNHLLHTLIVAFVVLISGCEHSSGHDQDEHKVPGKFVLVLNSPSGSSSIAVWSDLDGPGGASPIVDTLRLQGNTSYDGTLSIFTTDGDTLTKVILQQDTEHQLFYTAEGTVQNVVTISITDRDRRGMPLGLATRWVISSIQAPTTGAVRIQLYHYDQGIKDGVNPSSETDADIRFPLMIVP